ncbi:hypothetical protein PC128_g7571 [Phytophthora cactorum]|nr:hypothetical protein PC128_g7571 [Phytophthora cactorum]
MLKFNGVFRIDHGVLRSLRQKYTAVSHEFEIFQTETTTVGSLEDDGDIEDIHFVITKTRDLASVPIRTVVSACGVVTDIGKTRYIQSRNGDAQHKRDVILADQCAMRHLG